jgi:hypothetical protein
MMLHILKKIDGLVSNGRPTFHWVGQISVTILGIHLATDRLDDLLSPWLAGIQVAWPSPEAPLTAATWCAVAVELAIVFWATWVLVGARAKPAETTREWRERLSVRSVVAPLFWAPTSLAGAWVVGMAVEDLAAPWLLGHAALLGGFTTALVAWRLSATGFLRVLRRTPHPRSRLQGLMWAPVAGVVAGLAAVHGLPLWGWLG